MGDIMSDEGLEAALAMVRAGVGSTRTLSPDIRWRIVWKSYLHAKTAKEICTELLVSKATVKRVLSRFRANGSVVRSHCEKRELPWVKFTRARCQRLLELVADADAANSLTELRQAWLDETGHDVSLSTMCRAMARIGYTRKRVRGLHSVTRPFAH